MSSGDVDIGDPETAAILHDMRRLASAPFRAWREWLARVGEEEPPILWWRQALPNARAKRGWALALSESFARRGFDLEAATLLRVAPPGSPDSYADDRGSFVTLNKLMIFPAEALASQGVTARVPDLS